MFFKCSVVILKLYRNSNSPLPLNVFTAEEPKVPEFQEVELPPPWTQHLAVWPLTATILVYLYISLTVTVSPILNPSVNTLAKDGQVLVAPVKEV